MDDGRKTYENGQTCHSPFPDAGVGLGVPQLQTASFCLVIPMDFLSLHKFNLWPQQQLMAMSPTVEFALDGNLLALVCSKPDSC